MRMFGRLFYYWNRFWKKLPMSAISNSFFEAPSCIEAQSTIINTKFGKYSYCGYGCTLINCEIGRYCSLSDNVYIGLAHHPLEWVSTSPAFYKGRDSIPKDMASLEYDTHSKTTVIGNDVWIGANVMIKDGVIISNGAVIGMGSVVTKDVPPYSIVAGNPARVIKKRFPDELIEKLERSQWWNFEKFKIEKIAHLANNPESFLEELEKLE